MPTPIAHAPCPPRSESSGALVAQLLAVIGTATDAQASAPTRDPVSLADFRHTLLWLLGIDSRKDDDDSLGRPVALSDGGGLIPGLIARG